MLPKIIVIVGPTASGKTDLGIELAKEFNGEIISADSRQVYKQMTVATGKPVGMWQMVSPGNSAYIVEGIPHHAMDLLDPAAEFTVTDFKQLALDKIKDISKRGKTPFIVGGTGLYVRSLVDNLDIPAVPPNKELRQELASKSLTELVRLLKEKDPESAKRIDLLNPRRVLRALEVVLATGTSFSVQQTRGEPLVEALQIGLTWPPPQLRERIARRIKQQLKDGLIEEAERLVAAGYTMDLPSMSGIGYKEALAHKRGELTWDELEQQLVSVTWRYAKRQMTWFKTNQEIRWLEPGSAVRDVAKLVRDFLK